MSVISVGVNTARAATKPTTYTGENKVPAVIALWLILVAISVVRNGGKLPDQRHIVALGVATFILALSATIAPRIVFYVMLAAVLAVAFSNSDVIAQYVDKGTGALRGALGGAK